MKTIKIIDLLVKIANGEEVPLIKYRDKILHWNKEKDRFEDKDGMNTLYEMDFSELNEEVEIIEEDKKIERITNEAFLNSPFGELVGGKINEIIDYINKNEEEK